MFLSFQSFVFVHVISLSQCPTNKILFQNSYKTPFFQKLSLIAPARRDLSHLSTPVVVYGWHLTFHRFMCNGYLAEESFVYILYSLYKYVLNEYINQGQGKKSCLWVH